MENHKDTQHLTKYLLRMPKNDSTFLYFILESNEGIAFYSTMAFEKSQPYRDIEIYSTPELSLALKGILEHIKKSIN